MIPFPISSVYISLRIPSNGENFLFLIPENGPLQLSMIFKAGFVEELDVHLE